MKNSEYRLTKDNFKNVNFTVEKLLIDENLNLNDVEFKLLLDEFKNLKSLNISNQDITYLDLSNLINIESISLIANKKLINIDGFENLNKLSTIFYYNNSDNKDCLIKIIDFSKNKDIICNFDIIYLPFISDYLNNNLDNINFIDNKDVNKIKHIILPINNEYELSIDIINLISKNHLFENDTSIEKLYILKELLKEASTLDIIYVSDLNCNNLYDSNNDLCLFAKNRVDSVNNNINKDIILVNEKINKINNEINKLKNNNLKIDDYILEYKNLINKKEELKKLLNLINLSERIN